MKTKLFTLFIALVGFNSLQAQAPSYVDFEWDILRLGYAVPTSDGVSAGISFGGELRYNLKDNFSIGLGSDFILFDIKDADNDQATLGASSTLSLVGDYYLSTTSSKRAFVGLGIGRTANGSITIDDDDVDGVKGATGFSLAPRVGYEFGHLRLLATYSLGLKEELTDYFSLTAAITLWGGYRGE